MQITYLVASNIWIYSACRRRFRERVVVDCLQSNNVNREK